MCDVLAGKNVKQAAKARALEGVNTAKMKAANRVQRFALTGQGRARTWSRSTRRSTKRTGRKRKASASATKRLTATERTPQKRKASVSVNRRKQTK